VNTTTPRRPLDFYPTPANVTVALHLWCAPRELFRGACLDPAAGDGAIIRASREMPGLGEAHWSAIEINPAHESALEDVAENVIIHDALEYGWPDASAIANPPFGQLDAFWLRAVAHRQVHSQASAMLIPVAWWNAEKRSRYVRPDAILALGWRPSFIQEKNGPAHKGSQDFAWCVLFPDPSPVTEWHRLEKPQARERRAA